MDAQDQVAEVRASVQRLSRRLRAERPRDGLTTTKLSILARLLDHGPLTSAALAYAGRTTPQALTRSIEAMLADGLIDRAPHPTDGRQHLLRIAPAGFAALATDAAPRDAWLAAAMDDLLTPAERRLLAIAADLFARLAEYDDGTRR